MEFDIVNLWIQNHYRLKLYIMKKVDNEFDADDILQEVFLKLHRNIDSLRDESKLQSYIYQAARNSIIDYYKRKREPALDIDEIGDIIGADSEEVEDNFNVEISRCLKKFIASLPDKYKLAVELHDVNGKKHKDISKLLDISLSGSKTRVQRGRQKLRELLLECCDIEFDPLGNVINYKQKIPCGCESKNCSC